MQKVRQGHVAQVPPRQACQPLRQRLLCFGMQAMHCDGCSLLVTCLQGGGGGCAAPAAAGPTRHVHHGAAAARHCCTPGSVSGRGAAGLVLLLLCHPLVAEESAHPSLVRPALTAATLALCRRAPSASGAPQAGKRKLLPISSSFRLPGDAVPAHMMFAAKAPRLGGEAKPTASGLSSQL